MKNYTSFLFLFLILSCNNKQSQVQQINPNELHINTIVHDSLTSEQIEKIKTIHNVFAEVDKSSLEQTITDFKRDLHPESEIEIWLQMANAYEGYLSKNKKNLEEKKEVFKLILSRSMQSTEETIKNTDLKYLSKEDAEEVLSFYTNVPKPLTVEHK
ncbi:poly(ADP-ribose)glycohydrolase PARG [Flavobacterium sp. 270]|uniref:hypothetical protein n=1 Tax=Flavobacterium sp. 270 TaxID=2512114 RepID=UPI00106495BC|nr:hypothetical protein [Flavobacterium sp. 270]TDW52041.1 poly(ADP-ribose)glycohydrolase PARG [Flavobacterium sp. 270]